MRPYCTMILRRGAVTGFVLAVTAASVLGAELRIGAARVEIPVPRGARLAGYENSVRVAKEVHDPLYARVLVLKTAARSMAVVALDLYSFRSSRVAGEARRRFHLEVVLFANSGTHSGPAIDGSWAGSDAWLARIEDTILGAIELAQASTFAARLGAGAGTLQLGYNWRSVDENGLVTMLWKNPGRLPTGPLWPAVPVWRVDDEDGAMRAVVFSFTCQPNILGKENQQISGDYPGFAAARLESLFGGVVVCLFLQGASGDIVPFANEERAEQAFVRAKETGGLLAQEVARVAKSISTETEPNPSLSIYRTTEVFHSRWADNRTIPVETSTIVINKAYAIASVPGLPMVEFQIGLADRSPVRNALLVSHAFTGGGEWAGIIPPIHAAAQGGYGASYQTQVEVGAGEAILDDALVNLYRALGKLEDVPRGSLVRDMPPEGRKAR